MATPTRDDLLEALTSFRLAVRTSLGDQVSGEIADPDKVASVLHATLSRIAAERAPDLEAADASPATAALAEIRERQSRAAQTKNTVDWFGVVLESVGTDMPRLLAAVDAVLKLPVEWRRESEALRDAAGKVWEDTPDAPGVRLKHAYAAGYAECAKSLEAVITRELTKEEGGGNGS